MLWNELEEQGSKWAQDNTVQTAEETREMSWRRIVGVAIGEVRWRQANANVYTIILLVVLNNEKNVMRREYAKMESFGVAVHVILLHLWNLMLTLYPLLFYLFSHQEMEWITQYCQRCTPNISFYYYYKFTITTTVVFVWMFSYKLLGKIFELHLGACLCRFLDLILMLRIHMFPVSLFSFTIFIILDDLLGKRGLYHNFFLFLNLPWNYYTSIVIQRRLQYNEFCITRTTINSQKHDLYK